MIGQVIGNYRIERVLGEGGMGTVFMGVDLLLEREVAIKSLKPTLMRDSAIIERFLSEAKTLARLNHLNVATLYSFFREGDEYFMALEYVRGHTLHALMRRRGPMPCEEALPLFRQVLDGIAHAHHLGIIHRDIKPSNMMLTQEGTLKVLDFGIARILGSERMTRAGQLAGTIEYMAPEQVLGNEVDERTDIYSLGMLLYEMLTGRSPFPIKNEFELMRAQIEQMPTPPRALVPSIPEEIERAILRAIAKNPDERFQTALEFKAVLPGRAAAARPPAVPSADAYANRPSTPPRPAPQLAKTRTAAAQVPAATLLDTKVDTPTLAEGAAVEPVRPKKTRIADGTHAVGVPPARELKATRIASPVPDPTSAAAATAPLKAHPPAVAEPAAPAPKSARLFYAAAAGVVAVLVVLGAAAAFFFASSRGVSRAETPPPHEQPPAQVEGATTQTDAPAAEALPAAPQDAPTEAHGDGAEAVAEQPPVTQASESEPVRTTPTVKGGDVPSTAQTAEAAAAGAQPNSSQPSQRGRTQTKKSQPLSRRDDLKKVLTSTP